MERARDLEKRRALLAMEEYEESNSSVQRPGSASDRAILLRREVVQNLTIEHLQGLLRVSIYTIKQIKVSLKGRSKGRGKSLFKFGKTVFLIIYAGNKALSIKLMQGLNKEKKLASCSLRGLNAYLQERGNFLGSLISLAFGRNETSKTII